MTTGREVSRVGDRIRQLLGRGTQGPQDVGLHVGRERLAARALDDAPGSHVTPESIKDDVNQFLQSGAIKNHGKANSLLAKLNAAAAARARGQCSTAANIYQAFINELRA